MVRFLHSADWQIGMPARFLTEEAAVRYVEARFEAIRRIGRLAAEHDCAFVVVAGDVFDTAMPSRQTILRATDAMSAFRVPLYLLPGNHDPLGPQAVFRQDHFVATAPPHVRVVASPEPMRVAPGVELVGAPWTSKRPGRDLLAEALAPLEPSGGVRIAVAHGAVDTVMPAQRDRAETMRHEVMDRALREGVVQYVALGDRHSVTQVDVAGRIWYAGTPEVTAFDEPDPGWVLKVELEDGACRVARLRVGSWRLWEAERDLSGDQDLDRLEAELAALPDKTRTAVRLAVRGSLSLAQRDRLDRILEAAGDRLAGLELRWDRSSLAVVPDDLDFRRMGLAGFAQDAAAELRAAAAGGGAEAERARDALALLFRLARGGGP